MHRLPYEEPYHTQLVITASNGAFTGSTDIYVRINDLGEIGRALQAFPKSESDEYKFEYGSSDRPVRFYRHFVLRVYRLGTGRQCALQISINMNQHEPEEGICLFSIPTELAAIKRLGAAFVSFEKLQHLEFKWTPTGEVVDLHDQYQDRKNT